MPWMPRQQAAFVAAAWLAFALIAAPARAQVEPVRLVYEPYAGCPDEARFVEQVTAHVERARLAVGGELARAFLVSVHPDGPRSRGSLQITGLDGVVSRREVAGNTCAEVVAALALTTALAIDPQALATIEGPAAAPGAGPPDSTALAPAAPAPSAPSVAVPDRPVVPRPSSPRPRARPGARWRWASGVDLRALAGFVPGLAPGAGVFVDVARTEPRALVLSFRASLRGEATHASFSSEVGASLTWWLARVEACPAGVGLASMVATACVELDAGYVTSEGTGLANSAKDSRPWVVPGALGRVSWPSGGGLFVEGSGGVGVPLERYSFHYQRAGVAGVTEVYRMPAVGAEVGLAAGYRFP